MTQIMKLSLSQDMCALLDTVSKLLALKLQKFGAAFLERTKNVTL